MKRGLATADFTFPLLSHEKALDLISALDFAGVDIGLFEGRSHLWPSREYRNPARSGEKLRHKLQDRGLACADVFLQTDPQFEAYAVNHPNRKRRTQAATAFQKTVDYAMSAGAKHITILPGVSFREQESPKQSWDRAVEELSWRVDLAKESGIILGVEAHVGSIASTPEAALKLVHAVDGLTLTLDYTHFIRQGMAQARVDPLCQYASHIHIRGAKKGRLQVSYQKNVIDYTTVLKCMDDARYSGWIGIEYVWVDWEGCNECDNVSETILFRDALQTMMQKTGIPTKR